MSELEALKVRKIIFITNSALAVVGDDVISRLQRSILFSGDPGALPQAFAFRALGA